MLLTGYVNPYSCPVKRDIFVGLKFEAVDRYYDPDPDLKVHLIEVYSDDPAYSDGTLFDPISGYKFEAPALNGPCQYLKASISYQVRDTRCEVSRAFVCKWTGESIAAKPVDDGDDVYSFQASPVPMVTPSWVVTLMEDNVTPRSQMTWLMLKMSTASTPMTD